LEKRYSETIRNPTRNWNSRKDRMEFSLTAYSFSIKGDIQLRDGRVILTGNIPLLAIPFSSKIESTIRQNLEEVLR